jgi:catechol 2,3-dioxygenase-like lactoylglutathione lyase family enzyme
MTITLDHVNIVTTDLPAVRDFLVGLLGLEEGFRPPFDFPGHWLYLDGRPVIHLADRGRVAEDRGWVDHIAFAGFDFETQRARLDAGGYDYRAGGIPGGPRQLFVSGPGGLKVELQCTA